MLKFFAVIVLLYFFFRSAGHIIRLFLGKETAARGKQNPYARQQQRRTSRNGLHVDSMPKHQKQKKDFKGGDYVDYEDVK